jgi:mRNA-degrading endonuclease YafQ of YafQ-DinJ toxin-antitoxin module
MLFALRYTSLFVRKLKKLPQHLREEVQEKLVLFTDEGNHQKLKTHSLHGRLKGMHAFSVNYKVRVIVEIVRSDVYVLVVDVGDHSVYE